MGSRGLWVDMTLRGVIYFLELGLVISSKWTQELWNTLRNESVEDETIIPLITIWLGGYDCSPVLFYNVWLIRICFFLVSCDLITQKPLTMNCHNPTLGADAIKKSKERTQLHLLILQWKRKWTYRRKTTLVYSHGTCIHLLTPSSSDWIVNAKRKNLSAWWKNS